MNSRDNKENESERPQRVLTQSIGWFALGLGTAQLVAPSMVARLVGIKPTPWVCRAMRLLGVREALSGLGILRGKNAARWLGARVAGDALDAALLTTALKKRTWFGLRRSAEPIRLRSAIGLVAGVSVLDLVALRMEGKPSASGPSRPTVMVSITIDRTPADVYAFWRDVTNFPRFVSYVTSVQSSDNIRSKWQARLPGGKTLAWNATVVEDRPSQRIAWKLEIPSLAMIDSGEVRFEPAPGGRGTELHLSLWGTDLHAPKAIARWLRKLPEAFWLTQLRKLKQLLELGEITLSDASVHDRPHPARPSQDRPPTPRTTNTSMAAAAAGIPDPSPTAEKGALS